MSKVVFPWVWDGSKPVKMLGKSDGAAVVAPRPKLKRLNYDQTDTVASGGNYDHVTVQPDAGKIWYVRNITLMVQPPTGASSGYHYFLLRDSTWIIRWIIVNSTYSTGITVRYLTPEIADATVLPEDKSAFAQAIRSIVITNDKPLYVSYYNNTNANQTGTRTIRFMVIEMDEEP